MAIRTISQIGAGVLAGAVLVGVPAWAFGGQNGDDATPRTDRSAMMSGAQSQRQMTEAMSKMMKDPEIRKEMQSMMSDAMAQMPGMDEKAAGKGMSGKGMSGKGMSGM